MLDAFRMLRRLLRRQDKFELLAIAAATAIAALWEVLGIGLMIPVVAAVVNPILLEQNEYLKFFYSISPFQEQHSFMIFTALLVVINFALKNMFNYWVLKLQSNYTFGKQSEFSCRLFELYIKTDYSFALQHSPAELGARISRVGMICENSLLPLLLLLSDGTAVLLLLVTLMWFMPLVLAAALAALVLLALIFYCPFRKYNGYLSSCYVEQDNCLSSEKISVFSGIKAIKSANCEEFFQRRFTNTMRVFTRLAARLYLFGQLPRLGLEVLAVILSMGIFISMVLMKMPSGTIVLHFALLVAAMGRILPALSRMSYNLTRIRQFGVSLEGLYNDINALKMETASGNGSTISYHLQQSLDIRDMCFSYPDGKKVFDHFNLTIPARRSVALVGPTGSGKSTLADLICGLLKPDQGQILFDNQDIAGNVVQARAIIGYVPQYVYIIEGSIAENVALGVEADKIDMVKVIQALQLANLYDYVESLPEKTAAHLGENGINLSGGQRQRLGIARALYHDSELLIFDEATSALDDVSESAVVEALETLHGRKTLLVIAHRLSTIEHCDTKITLG